jgi:hypothetical protein
MESTYEDTMERGLVKAWTGGGYEVAKGWTSQHHYESEEQLDQGCANSPNI